MGFGDDILAVGQAINAGARETGIVIGRNWEKPHRSVVYEGLDWVNPPGGAPKLLRDYPGHRGYIDYAKSTAKRQVLLEDYRAERGQVVATKALEYSMMQLPRPESLVFVALHTDVKRTYSGENRLWPEQYWLELARRLLERGFNVLQVDPAWVRLELPGVARVPPTDRLSDVFGVIEDMDLVVTSEGLFHHAAAALKTDAVVLWGGRLNPEILGYEGHANLTAREEWCGSWAPCDHCTQAMLDITPDRVFDAVMGRLDSN